MLKPLEGVIGYHFKNPGYLREALSHKSFASESKSGVCNERLEFLGDSVLAAVVAHQLYIKHQGENEGSLSKKKAQLVSRQNLARWACELNLGAYIYLGVGEESSGGRTRLSLLGNTLEALIGAMYLDGGYQTAERFIAHGLMRHAEPEQADYKSRLQECLQKKYKMPPTYETTHAAGPDHDRTFHMVVHLGKKILGRGEGKNKRQAEQAAARNALEMMSQKV